MANKANGNQAPTKGGKFDLVTKTPKILSKKIKVNPIPMPKARFTPIPPLRLKEETATAMMVNTKADKGRL